jgi:hypothetical protein
LNYDTFFKDLSTSGVFAVFLIRCDLLPDRVACRFQQSLEFYTGFFVRRKFFKTFLTLVSRCQSWTLFGALQHRHQLSHRL